MEIVEIVEIVDWQVAGRLADLQEAQKKETNQSMISQDGERGGEMSTPVPDWGKDML